MKDHYVCCGVRYCGDVPPYKGCGRKMREDEVRKMNYPQAAVILIFLMAVGLYLWSVR